MLSAIFNCFTIPIKVAYQPQIMNRITFFFVNLVIDLIFALDMIITFRTCYVDEFGREIDKPILIAKNYLFGEFWIDLFATLPLDVIIISFLD